MSEEFSVIDFETANASLGSICQVGIVKFDGLEIVDEWSTLVNPEDYFSSLNSSIHGIHSHHVEKSPKLPDIFEEIRERIEGRFAVCHTPFDKAALRRATEKYNLETIGCTWIDSAKIVRRCWEHLRYEGYGLSNVCGWLGIEYKAHDALEDARATGLVVLNAMAEHDFSFSQWVARLDEKPSSAVHYASLAAARNVDSDFSGDEIVFTGRLALPRDLAEKAASSVGMKVGSSVTRRTTILIVGDQDLNRFAGFDKSSKHRKAEDLILSGQAIRILAETDFLEIVDHAAKA